MSADYQIDYPSLTISSTHQTAINTRSRLKEESSSMTLWWIWWVGLVLCLTRTSNRIQQLYIELFHCPSIAMDTMFVELSLSKCSFPFSNGFTESHLANSPLIVRIEQQSGKEFAITWNSSIHGNKHMNKPMVSSFGVQLKPSFCLLGSVLNQNFWLFVWLAKNVLGYPMDGHAVTRAIYLLSKRVVNSI